MRKSIYGLSRLKNIIVTVGTAKYIFHQRRVPNAHTVGGIYVLNAVLAKKAVQDGKYYNSILIKSLKDRIMKYKSFRISYNTLPIDVQGRPKSPFL